MTEPAQGMTLEEAQKQIWAAVEAITKAGFTLAPPAEVSFSVTKPEGWRRHQVVCTFSGRSVVIERFWSWDRADTLAAHLNDLVKKVE